MENQETCRLAFCRRRANLFKKAQELSTLCGAQVAVVAISKSGKVSLFPGSEYVIQVYNEYKKSSPPDTSLRKRTSPEISEEEDDDVIERKKEADSEESLITLTLGQPLELDGPT